MKTLAISIKIEGKVTVPDLVIAAVRAEAQLEVGSDVFLSRINAEFPTDDEAFIQAALRNALRNIARNGIIKDIGGMGVGVKCAPAEVTVSVPERVVTMVKGREQVHVDSLAEDDVRITAADRRAKHQSAAVESVDLPAYLGLDPHN